MQRWQRGVSQSGRVRMLGEVNWWDQEFLCLSSSLSPKKLRILLPLSGASSKGVVFSRSLMPEVPVLSKEWCFLPALWFRGTFSCSISCCSSFGPFPCRELQKFGQAAKLSLQRHRERGNHDAPLYLSAKAEWGFMRQRKGTSPPAELLIKGLLHTVEV